MKNYRVLSLALALVMLIAVVFPAGVFADDDLLEDEALLEETIEGNQIEDEYLDDLEDRVQPAPTENENEELINEDEALPKAESVNNEDTTQADNEDLDLEVSEKNEFLTGKPEVTPPEDVEAAVGETVTFKVTATGAAPFTYKWQTKLVGKTTWQNTQLGGYNTDTLSFPMAAIYNGREYRCIVTDANGNSTTSESAKLTEAAAGPVVTGPEDAEAAVGETVTFKVTAMEIPKTVNGMTVTEIGQEAFMNNANLISIKLPETITIIHARAFKDCINLKEMK